MLKETHHFIIFIMIIILLMTLFTFFLTYSMIPHEEEVPRRSRAVVAQYEAKNLANPFLEKVVVFASFWNKNTSREAN